MTQIPATLGRMPVEQELLGVKVECQPLKFEQSRMLLPDVVRFLTKAASVIGEIAAAGITGMDDIKKILKFLPRLDAEQTGYLMDMLERHHKKLLSSTTVIMTNPANGALENFELVKADRMSIVFNERPDLYVPICIFAGRVSFQRFFPATGQPEEGTTAPES